MAIKKTRAIFPMELSVGATDVFWEQLESYPIEEIEEAFKWARGNLHFFPKPVDILDYIKQKKKAW